MAAATGGASLARAASVPAQGTVTVALPADNQPNYIFPMVPGQDSGPAEETFFIPPMYESLYWYQSGTKIAVDSRLSLADPAVFSTHDGHTVATITLKSYRWSTGQPITTRDVQFWMNILEAEKDNYSQYTPGDFPDNIIAQSYTTERTFSLTFNRVYNDEWLLYNELSQIIPIPHSSWDRTSPQGPVGNFDDTLSGARAVYNFLNGQSTTLTTYASNPLWKVVDGPWRLTAYSAVTGYSEFSRNYSFRGPGPTPSLSHLVLEPFTSDAAEYDSLKSGALDYGYVPTQDANPSQLTLLRHDGYNIEPEPAYAIGYILLNFTNTTGASPLLKQLYIREAMQHLINDRELVSDIFHGYAIACYGPVPCTASSSLLDSAELRDPDPYSVSAAITLLREHGWSVNPLGTTVCDNPGIGVGECGSGIAAREPLSLNMIYDTGYNEISLQMQAIKSAFSLVGISLTLTTAPFNTVLNEILPCDASTGVGCTWELGDWQNPDAWFFTAYPSGELPFGCGSFENAGGYCNASNTRNIAATLEEPGSEPMFRYESYLEKEIPVLWVPTPDDQISAIRRSLHGVVQGPLLDLDTQAWSMD
jgi:peptide/nickel transport system substrate-binding protein